MYEKQIVVNVFMNITFLFVIKCKRSFVINIDFFHKIEIRSKFLFADTDLVNFLKGIFDFFMPTGIC